MGGGGGGGGDGVCCSEYCINDHSYNCILSLSSLRIAVGLNLLPSLLVTGMGTGTGIWYWQEPPTWYDRQNF